LGSSDCMRVPFPAPRMTAVRSVMSVPFEKLLFVALAP
jgi:hypothetical protein